MSNAPKFVLLIVILAALGAITLLFFQTPSRPDILNPSSSNTSESVDSNGENTTDSTSEFAFLQQGGKYFSPRELEQIGIEVDLNSIKYRSDIKLDLLSALLSPDGIPSIDEVIYETAWEADEWLNDEDIVMTVRHGDITRAYPTLIMTWHEIANDMLGDLPVAITFCPLCNSGLIFIRPEISGTFTEFGTSGRIYQSDLVMYDRVTGSLWSQIEGRPIMGPLVEGFDGRLEQIPTGLTKWGFWKEANPDTEVLARPTTAQRIGNLPPTSTPENAQPYPRNYSFNPYEAYLTDNSDTFNTPFGDRRLDAKADVVGIRLDDETAKAYLKESLELAKILNDELAGIPILVLWDEDAKDALFFERTMDEHILEFRLLEGELTDTETNSLWNLKGAAISGPFADEDATLEQIVGITTFWFAWFNFHPHTELYAEK
jgi:hypothetical protein